jgi:(R,R)-butanediol dehydrogenase/meso-butanediol dehydrogenase/diacetyl reductase
MMKAAVYYGPGDVKIVQVPQPEAPGEGMVTLRIERAALCGTDATLFKSPLPLPLLHTPHEFSGHRGPVIIGHEVVGVVTATGPGVIDLKKGQRVVPGSGAWCGECPPCQEGRTNICERYFLYGVHANGGMAEFANYPAEMCVPVPLDCPPDRAVLAQPTAVAIHALDRAKIASGQTVVFFGVGGIGSLMLAILQAQYQKRLTLFAVDVAPAALKAAARLATYVLDSRTTNPVQAILEATEGRGCDIVIEATGAPGATKQALACVKRGGRLLQVGIPTEPTTLLMDTFVQQEKELIATNGQVNATDLARALDLLTHTDLITHIPTTTIDLDDLVERGLRPLVEHRAPGKVVVNIGK